MASSKIGIIDVFAGPGGLGEGFSRFETPTGKRPFKIGVSAEMEKSAHETLRLRAFLRSLREDEGDMPEAYAKFLESVAKGTEKSASDWFSEGEHRQRWENASEEALNLTLGDENHDRILYDKIRRIRKEFESLILIGGPPCQAYSLVGRARQKNVPGFESIGDKKHFLYKEYLRILGEFTPDIFIMENVKGILTSTVGGQRMFDMIKRDLANPRRALNMRDAPREDTYVLLPIHVRDGEERDPAKVLADPTGFIIRSERHGLPQARHRVIIMGVSRELATRAISAPRLEEATAPTLEQALSGLPRLRSGISRAADNGDAWANELARHKRRLLKWLERSHPMISERLEKASFNPKVARSSYKYTDRSTDISSKLKGSSLFVTSHEARSHMVSDLGRYLFAAAHASSEHRSPKSNEFPTFLAPDHVSWGTGAFSDRFRVQLRDRPSSTVTSHLSKDGHAFIHWDASQCRSLTVREAARLQTFPDDYIFLGNRTQQYVQVGNAVPPMLAEQIASVVWSIFHSSTRSHASHEFRRS
ncbi:DNA (cytosine-5)-methyltransferase 1 [Luteibacter rhizovicinus]|uniref:DNA (cytosine-5-)-methyltransferase n=1 Tax=Luteibacter rhizovicinus TaxID=242606 RepID=A0A4R3YLE1_9GAMM|nr:DNA (cytosine-5-)-methyltransferase [Luteibacter rhizovicinus]TCV91623.1 DNA (cytosine-5)-methyltransferase 1 [Luteibacter rhizovicinus]